MFCFVFILFFLVVLYFAFYYKRVDATRYKYLRVWYTPSIQLENVLFSFPLEKQRIFIIELKSFFFPRCLHAFRERKRGKKKH